MEKSKGFLENYFKFEEKGTKLSTEINAGFTTFMTMAYILAVNPLVLSATGMDPKAIFTATVISSAVATLLMGLLANLPFALAPGMGLNAFFAYSVVLSMGKSWQFALTAVFIEGIIFILLTFFNVREAIINSIPMALKKAISVGIGLFIAFIGFTNSGIIVQGEGIPVMLGDLFSKEASIAIICLIIIGILLAYRFKGAILIGIIVGTIMGIATGLVELPEKLISSPPSMTSTLFQFEWNNIFSKEMVIVVFTFLMIDMFDTVGTLIGVATKSKMLDENNKLPRAKHALFADAVGTTLGACLGTSTVTTYVESASGVAEGGRTGMTAVTTSVLFLLSLFFAPLFLVIPAAATAPALIIVGSFMMSPVKEIDWEDFTDAIPAFLTIIIMPLAYSISEGIIFGVVSYVIIKLISGRSKDVHPLAYVIAVAFMLAKWFL